MAATKMSLLRPPLPFTTLYTLPRAAAKPLKPLHIRRFTATCQSFSSLPYGPSLHKGHSPKHPTTPDETLTFFDESIFTRVFDVSALRVPSSLCSTLETRLRGHLLNWPRVKNIARVSGDELQHHFKTILPPKSSLTGDEKDEEEEEKIVSLNRRIYGKAEGDGEMMMSDVLYRDKLVKSFDSRGFVKFRNLAKISRPKKKTKREEEEGSKRVVKGVGRNELALVELVEEDGDDDFSGLLGEGFEKWRGSTRLLLLDERFDAGKGVEDLPEAIKVVLQDQDDQSTRLAFELVKCKLTLFYDYWQMNEILEVLLPKGMIIPSAFEMVGHIAHLNLKEEHLPYRNLIAKVILDKNKPKIQTVVNKIDAIQNDYRTMQLEVLAGNNSLVTSLQENGLRFHVDLATVYWNSKLASERQRLLSFFTHNDVVCDVFSGVGPIAIAAAKKVKHVYANDLNPCAVEYLERNCIQNKVERKIEVYNMDGRRFIEAVFASQRVQSITQVVMNLPKDAAEFLDVFRGIFHRTCPGRECTLPRIHVYGFSKAQDPEFDFHERIKTALSEVAFDVEMHRVRLVAPGKWMLCASFILPERVAYSETGSIL